ncbi:MAG: hypothetical protein LCH73_12920 [Proteobacteria bacterium]|nr:hypothetical protein [Pseudomonadota bacterium]
MKQVMLEQKMLEFQATYPDMKDLSRSGRIAAMRRFCAFLRLRFEVVPQPAGQMP